jgi:hypothetical protein
MGRRCEITAARIGAFVSNRNMVRRAAGARCEQNDEYRIFVGFAHDGTGRSNASLVPSRSEPTLVSPVEIFSAYASDAAAEEKDQPLHLH